MFSILGSGFAISDLRIMVFPLQDLWLVACRLSFAGFAFLHAMTRDLWLVMFLFCGSWSALRGLHSMAQTLNPKPRESDACIRLTKAAAGTSAAGYIAPPGPSFRGGVRYRRVASGVSDKVPTHLIDARGDS